MTDEDVIRRRLLIDGDGTGDDRRLNMLLKKFIKWSSSTNDTPEESQTEMDVILAQLTLCEHAYKKSHIMGKASAEEIKNYEKLLKKMNEDIEQAKKQLEEKKAEFKEAKTIRKNRAEYEVLADVINQQPDRKESIEKVLQLKREISLLQEENRKLDEVLELRRSQFHILMSSIHQLKEKLAGAEFPEGNSFNVKEETSPSRETEQEDDQMEF